MKPTTFAIIMACLISIAAGCSSAPVGPQVTPNIGFHLVDGFPVEAVFHESRPTPVAKESSIVILVEGSVIRPGFFVLSSDATVADLAKMKDGPGFLYCVIGMYVVRELETGKVVYHAWGSTLFSEPFPLRNGDRVYYEGGGF